MASVLEGSGDWAGTFYLLQSLILKQGLRGILTVLI